MTVHSTLVAGLNMYVKTVGADTGNQSASGLPAKIPQSNCLIYSLGNTPIKLEPLRKLIANYPFKDIANEILNGFQYGFSLQYSGSRLPRESSNLKSAEQSSTLLYEKLAKEVQLGRVAGPFLNPPFPTLQVSPLGLVPKKDGDFRVIHHLSYPEHRSINDFIDKNLCSVQYSSIDKAAALINRYKSQARLSQCDVKSAFRLIPIAPSDFDLLGMKFGGYYYYDKMLPFGASISCALWEKFATSLHWIVEMKSGNDSILHYLDDYFFVENSESGNVGHTLRTFQNICHEIGVPLNHDKTTPPCQSLTFLGITFDVQKLIMSLPEEKVSKLKEQLCSIIQRKKATLREMQSLLGLLNFACKVISPGRTFCRRLINSTIGVKKQHHKIRITEEMKLDLGMWLKFLEHYNGITVITDDIWESNEMLELWTDASGGSGGYGIYFGGKYALGTWPRNWVEDGVTRDMTFLELFPIVAAFMTWETYFYNKKVLLHVDNQSVIQIVNTKTSKSTRVMKLVRHLVLMNLKNNTHVKAIYIPSKHNIYADLLSRSKVKKFKDICPNADPLPTKINPLIWEV